MAIFSKMISFLTGGVGEKIVDTVTRQFPPRLSEGERKQITEAIRGAAREHELKLIQMAQEEQTEFDSRIKDLEGTAKDLNQSGWLGRIIIFLRGAQRPLWGYFVLVLDIMVFSGKWKLTVGTAADTPLDLVSAFWIVNLLVLGFLFGERAVRNVMPIIRSQFPGQKAQG